MSNTLFIHSLVNLVKLTSVRALYTIASAIFGARQQCCVGHPQNVIPFEIDYGHAFTSPMFSIDSVRHNARLRRC